MRLNGRLTLALAAWLQLAALPLVAVRARAQEAPTRLSQLTGPAPVRADAAREDAAPRTIDVDLEDAPLPDALSEIARLGHLRLTYSPDVLPSGRRVSLHATSITPGDALRRALRGTALEVSVTPGRDATIYRPAGAEQAQGTITGRVTDAATGTPIAGARVEVANTELRAATTEDGKFALTNVPVGTQVVQVRMLGYAPQQQTVTVADGETLTLQFVLERTAMALADVVVIGYGTQERKDLTGSISSVKGEQLADVPAPTVSAALQGKAAGLQVISSGVPGSDATFRIRGISTIGNSNPLVVIDGVPTMSGLNELNPADIASIEVLKDASATAIYGSRGANGVVIVTTKRGSAGEAGLRVQAYTGVQQVAQTVHMLDAAQFAQLHNEMMDNAGRPTNPAFADPSQLGTGTDWLGALMRQAPISSVTASYSGASEKSNVYASGNVLRQDGVVLGTGFERYTLQLNTDTHVRDWLTFGNNLTLNHDVNRSGNYNIQAAMGAQPTQPILNPDGTWSGPVGRSEWVGDIVNPIGQAQLIDNSTSGYNLIGSLHGEATIGDHLRFRTNLGMQANFWNNRTWSPKYDWQPSPQEQSYLFEQANRSTTWLVDNTLTYQRLFARSHDVTLMAGTSAQANRFSFMNGSVQGFQSDRTQELGNGIMPPTLGGNESQWGLLSFMGRASYSYNDTYLVTATMRRDGSSRFGSGNKWGLFPSLSGAWRISNESFFPKSRYLDALKLRAGYGETGNQEIGNYSFSSVLNTIQYNFGGNLVSAVVPNVMPNPNVHWETVRQLNVGLDASGFDDRVRLTLDGYVKTTTGMLVPMSVPVTTGYSDIVTPFINAGRMQNRGFEATLSTDNLRGAVRWSSDFTFALNRNRVLSLNDTIPMPVGSIDFNYTVGRLQVGHPMNAFYGFVTNGIFQTQEEVDAYAVQVPGADPYNRTSPGDIRFVDLNNDGVINDADRTFIGDPNPDFTFGLGNSVAARGFDLHVFLQGSVGGDIFAANRIWTEGMSSARNQTTAVLDRWTGPGTSNSMPRAVFGDPNGNTRVSDRYIEDGSYLRLKEVTLGYTLPADVARRFSMPSARVYLSGQNLLTLTGYSGFDPEVGLNGIDNNVYPVTRTMSVGVNVGF